MVRIAIVVEGQTEFEFVSRVLAPGLWEGEVYLFPSLIGRRGGNVSVDSLAADMVGRISSFDYVTSLVDFYGFRGKGDLTCDALEEHINAAVAGRVHRPQVQPRVFAYVQQYEFEGLPFSNVNVFESELIAPDECVEQLRTIRENVSSPEDINDSSDTAPSKRISSLIPNYNKRIDGPLLAGEIGLETIRRECPRFNAWVTRMESLDNTLSRDR